MEKMMNVKRRRRGRTRSFGIDDDDESSNGVIERRCWSDLPSDLLEPIMSKLFFIDQINFRAVCKSWHSLDRVPPLKQMPWLMVFDDEVGSHSWDSCKLVDPTYKKTYTIDMSSINKKKNLKDCRVKIHESKYGWLLMSYVLDENLTTSTHSLFLYSPFIIDNNIIELPVLIAREYIATFDLILNPSKKKKKEEGFEVLVLSSSDRNQNICIRTCHICIRTCRQGDNSWSCNKTIWNFQLYRIHFWVYSEGIFYYASNVGKKLESYDIARNNWTKFPAFLPEGPIGDVVMIKFYYGDIFLISITNMTSPCWGSMNVSLYKLDLSKGKWESIDNLSDRALFFGDGYSSFLELDNNINELKDQKQQKVYFCYDSVLKHCNVLGETRSYSCSKHYGSLARGKLFCRRLWIDPPRRPHIRNSL